MTLQAGWCIPNAQTQNVKINFLLQHITCTRHSFKQTECGNATSKKHLIKILPHSLEADSAPTGKPVSELPLCSPYSRLVMRRHICKHQTKSAHKSFRTILKSQWSAQVLALILNLVWRRKWLSGPCALYGVMSREFSRSVLISKPQQQQTEVRIPLLHVVTDGRIQLPETAKACDLGLHLDGLPLDSPWTILHSATLRCNLARTMPGHSDSVTILSHLSQKQRNSARIQWLKNRWNYYLYGCKMLYIISLIDTILYITIKYYKYTILKDHIRSLGQWMQGAANCGPSGCYVDFPMTSGAS